MTAPIALWSATPVRALFADLRRENPRLRAAETLTLAREAVRAGEEGFRIEDLPDGRRCAVWGGALWASIGVAEERNTLPVYGRSVLLSNALRHRDNVTGWMRTEGWFGDSASGGSARAAVRWGMKVRGRRSTWPGWAGEDGIFLEVLAGVDAIIGWAETRGDPVI